MGFTYATILAQLVHEAILLPSLVKPMRLRPYEHASAAHREMFRRVSTLANPDGMVRVADVPPTLINSLLSPALLWTGGQVQVAAASLSRCDWLVPLSAFAHEPANEGDEKAFVLQGFDLADGSSRANVARAQRLNPTISCFFVHAVHRRSR